MIDTKAMRAKSPSDSFADEEVFSALDEIDRLRAELEAVRAEVLLDLKEMRADRDAMKAWVAALFAHVCRMAGKSGAGAPNEVQKIARAHEATSRAAFATEVAQWCAARAAEHKAESETLRDTYRGLAQAAAAAAMTGASEVFLSVAAGNPF